MPAIGRLPDHANVCQFVHKLYLAGHGYDKIEKTFRKYNLPIFLFGEDRKDYQIHENKRYSLNVAVSWQRKDQLVNIEPGCHNENENLRRLQETGVWLTDFNDDLQLFAKKEIVRFLKFLKPRQTFSYVEPYYSAICNNLTRSDMMLLFRKGCRIDQIIL